MSRLIMDLVNTGLKTAGFKLVRSDPMPPAASREIALTAGHHAELIGPPGAGKSTTLDRLDPETAGLWLFRSDLVPLALEHKGRRFDHTRKKIYMRRMENLEGHRDSFEAIRFASYLAGIFMNDLKATHGEVGAGVLLDEGICQVCKQEILELSDEDFVPLVAGRAIAALMPRDPEVVVEQIIKRALEAVPRKTLEPVHILRDKVTWSIDMCEQLMDRLEHAGIRTLTLPVEDGATSNARALGEFLNSLPQLDT